MADATKDVISVDPTAAYEGGAFIVTGHVASPYGVESVSLRGLTNNGINPLGTASLDAAGDFSLAVPIRGTSVDDLYVTETNGSGASKALFQLLSLDGHWYGEPFVATEDEFTSTGARTQTLYFRDDGSVQKQVVYAPSGSAALQRVNNPDGTETTTVTETGATVQALAFDTIKNGSAPGNTFVFDPGDGLDVVQQFRGAGADHDTLSFKGSDFGNSIGQVLADTHQYRGVGTYIVDPVSGDAVRITNVSKAELAANKGDIAFHA